MTEWDLFDIFNANEDNYTNMLRFLYETEEDFKNRFIELIFGEKIDDISLKTRMVYKKGKNGKIIPDIVLHDKNHLAIIEVKMFSSEGYKQTERYNEDSPAIKETLSINTNCKTKLYFLTIDGIKPQCNNFIALKWNDVLKCMNPNMCKNDMAKLLMHQFKTRIDSMNPDNIIIKMDKYWIEQVHSFRWSRSLPFYKAIKSVLDKDKDKWTTEHWSGFDKNTQSYSHTVKFYPKDKSWQGKTLEDALKSHDTSNCFDYHFEFQWNETNNILTLRLDYELNPYQSQSDINHMEDKLKNFAIECNKKRAEKARLNKKIWEETINEFSKINPKHKNYIKNYKYNKSIPQCILKLVSAEYKNENLKGKTVEYVLYNIIYPFVNFHEEFIKKIRSNTSL